MLISTFEPLAQGHSELEELLDYIKSVLPHEEEDAICHAVISLTCDNPLEPLVGQALLDRLTELFHQGCNPPDLLSLSDAVSHRIGELNGLSSQIACSGGVKTYFDVLARTASFRQSFPGQVHAFAG